MKYLIALGILFALNSCNTSIGLYRDTKQAYNWTKEKFQGAGSGGGDAGGGYDSGASVY